MQRRCRIGEGSGTYAKKGLGAMEREIVEHVKITEGMLYGFTRFQLRRLAFEYAEANGVANNFNVDKKEAGVHWLTDFMHRHNDTLSLRTPEATSAERARGFNSVSVGKFFTLLEGLQDKHHLTSDRIYNVDETGVSTVPNRPSRITAARGKKQVGVLSSAERGQLVTVEICMSASGEYVPPMFIFPRERKKPELMEKARPGSIAEPHESGWMQPDIFVRWLEHFVAHTHPTATKPVLLILDGHKTHTSNMPFIEMARKCHVVVLCLTPHCSHRLQPLDVTFIKPLMTFYTQEVEKWLRNHPGKVFTT